MSNYLGLEWLLAEREAIICLNRPFFTWGKSMASRKKRMAAKSKRSKMRSKPHKKTVARAASPKKKGATKKRPIKRGARQSVSPRPKSKPRRRAPVVKDTIVDIVDEPMPGVVRVTEIEEVSVASPEEDNAE
jgi:hypothetical protein